MLGVPNPEPLVSESRCVYAVCFDHLLTEGYPTMSTLLITVFRLLKTILRAAQDREFRALLLITLTQLVSGTLFYSAHEGWSIIDSVYFCVMTMSTVGYGDLTPTTDISKVFTVIFSVVSIGIFVGLVSKLASAMYRFRHDDPEQS